MAPAQHVVRGVQMAGAGSGARKASAPCGPPPTRRHGAGGRGNSEREVLKPPRRAIHKHSLPPPLKAVSRTDAHGGIPRTASKPFAAPAQILARKAALGGLGHGAGVLLTPASQMHSAQKKSIS